MNYPLITEYIEAIKSAEDNFEELKHLRPVLDDDGEPVMTSGNFAVVFKMKDEQIGKLYTSMPIPLCDKNIQCGICSRCLGKRIEELILNKVENVDLIFDK